MPSLPATLPPAFATLDGETALRLATAKRAAIFQADGATYYTPHESAGVPRDDWRGPFNGAHQAARNALADMDALAKCDAAGVHLFHSMGAACWAPKGVAISGNISGAGWRTGFHHIADAARDACAVLGLNGAPDPDRVTLRHVDTCLSSFVLDHCNGEREFLLGVHVDHESTYASVKAGLLDEWNGSDLSGRLDAPTDDEFVAVLESEFAGAPQPLEAFKFTSLEAPADDDDDEPAESPQAWFRVAWSAPEEAEEPPADEPAPAYSLDPGRCIVGPSGLRLVALQRVQIPESEHPDRASGAHTLSGPEADRFAHQIVDALNRDPRRPDIDSESAFLESMADLIRLALAKGRDPFRLFSTAESMALADPAKPQPFAFPADKEAARRRLDAAALAHAVADIRSAGDAYNGADVYAAKRLAASFLEALAPKAEG